MTERARQLAALAALTVVYFVGVTAAARARPFWYDEIYLLIAAKAPDLAGTWNIALATDANPPLPHLLAHLSIRFLGLNEVTVRLPAMIGFWTFCLSLFFFVRRRKGAVFGFTALLLPLVTDAYSYAIDARAYGPVLGFCGLALVAWQAAAEGRRRIAALPLLAASIAGMLLCQYYAVLIYLPLAGAELVRARRARKLDWGVAAACAAGAAPLVWRVASVLHAVKAFSHGWAGAYLKQGIEFWENGLQHGAAWLAFLVFLSAMAAATRRREPPVDDPTPVPHHEWVAGALFVCIPLVAVLSALLVTHAFTPRYGVLGLAGFCLLVPLLVAEYCGAKSRVGALMAAVLAWAAVVTLVDHPDPRNPFTEEPALAAALKQGPVVVSDGQLYLQMWHYAPQQLKPRLVFLVDEAAAVKYMGFDTLDKGGGALRTWAGATAPPYDDFVKTNREFLLYRNLARPEWVLSRVLDEGASVEVRSLAFRREMLRIHFK